MYRFVRKLTVPRAGRPPAEFSVLWTPAETAAALRTAGHTHAEYLDDVANDDRPGKMYLDAETRLPTGDAPPAEVVAAFMERVHEGARLISRSLPEALGLPANTHIDYVIATRHGVCPKTRLYKLSARPFFSGVRVRHRDIPAVLGVPPDHKDPMWDWVPFKARDQLLCAINGKKGRVDGHDDPRILRPAAPLDDDDDALLRYVVQHVDPAWPLVTPDMRRAPDRPSASPPAPAGPAAATGAVEGAVEALVDCLGPATAERRETWRNVAIVLKMLDGGGDRYRPAWLRFSRKGGAHYVDDADCIKHWNSVRARTPQEVAADDPRRKPLTVATLHAWAMRDAPDAYAAWSATYAGSTMVDFGGEGVDCASPWDCSRVVSAAASAIGQDAADAVSDARVVGGRVLFTCGGVRHTVDLATLCVEPGRKFLHADPEAALSCGSVLLPNTTVPAAGWRVSRPCETVRLKNDGPPRTFVDLDMVGNTVVRAVATFPDTGKTAPVKGGKAMLDMLGGVVRDAIGKHLEGALGVPSHVVNNIVFNTVFNGSVTVGGCGEDGAAGDFDAMSGALLHNASERRLKKAGGTVYEPVAGCLCAYRPMATYEAYINTVLKHDAVYRANPRRFDEMMKFLTNYTELDEMPELRPDRNLLSFANGVLRLDDLLFTPYADMNPAVVVADRVARHHIDAPYTGCAATPLLDVVLDAQFGADAAGREVADLLLAFLGRLLFPIGSRDRWQAMPYLVGVGGTGKSLLLSVADAMFRKGAVGNLGGKREDVFGMANLVDKEAVFGRDMPAKLSGALSQELMQAMVSGEAMEVPRKGQVALNVDWAAPVIMASNHMPDYVNTGNNVGRRIVIFRFANVVRDPVEDLLDRIRDAELPNVVCRALAAYRAATERAAAAGGFWKSVPPKVLEWRGDLAAATNKLHEFLAMDDDERGCAIRRVEGRVTWVVDLEAAFAERFGQERFVLDAAVLAAFGFTANTKYENVCKSCKQVARGGKGRCCPAYDKGTNRTKKLVIQDMVVEGY